MTIWTVMFGDDPLDDTAGKMGRSARVKVFNSRRTAYSFRNFCKRKGLYADVIHHPHRPAGTTIH